MRNANRQPGPRMCDVLRDVRLGPLLERVLLHRTASLAREG